MPPRAAPPRLKIAQPLDNQAVALVPRAGIEPARPFRAKGFSCHYGFRHRGASLRFVCGPDYSFTIETISLGVSCLVSAPSSVRRLGSRLPSALPVKAPLNLRHSTSFLSERALNLVLPLTHTRKVKINSRVFQIIIPKNYSKSLVSTISPPRQGLGRVPKGTALQIYNFFLTLRFDKVSTLI